MENIAHLGFMITSMDYTNKATVFFKMVNSLVQIPRRLFDSCYPVFYDRKRTIIPGRIIKYKTRYNPLKR